MGPIKRLVAIVCAAIVLAIIAYPITRSIASFRQGYSLAEMDWNQKGSTTLSDFLEASDIGKREVLKDGKKCVEYYAYKDGMPVKTVCPKHRAKFDTRLPSGPTDSAD